MGADWSSLVKWQGDWDVMAGYATLLRLPEGDRGAGMGASGPRTLSFADWLSAFRLSASKQFHQIAKPGSVRSVWDVSLPHGLDWFNDLSGLPPAFLDEATFQGLP
jgi:hypothetical protein